MISIETIETPSLGDRSYLAHDGQVAVVVDPQRDIDRVLALAEQAGVRIAAVFETHIHNDYVTGGLALAQRTGASYHVNADDDVAFERTPIRDGETVQAGSMTVRAIHTPGHTFTHLSYALEADGQVQAVFTGGSLLFGSTGRPDLLGQEHAEELARHQYASAHRLADELPGETQVMPTHGFGSFCSASQAQSDASTIAREQESNPVLRLSEDEYLRDLFAGLTAYPTYYAHMGPSNAAGPSVPEITLPERTDVDELARRLEAGEWVVDLRDRKAYAAGHVPGTVGIALEQSFVTYLGWLVPWDAAITLLGESEEQVLAARRELMRIGIDRIAGQATGGPQEWTEGELGSYPVATFADLAQVRHHRPVTIVDVRRTDEHATSRIEGAVSMPLQTLGDTRPGQPVEGLPTDAELWVHCAGGYRASVAASLLARAGHRVVAIDDGFDNAGAAGLPVHSGGLDA